MRPRQINRGFAAIGLHRPKDRANVGGAIRAAMCYDVASIAISGDRIDASWIKTPSNTVAGQRHIPVLRGDLRGLIPYGAVPVAVDLVDDAEPLPTFVHPESAFYVFGPEDGTLGSVVLDWCPRRVMVPTRYCMNLAATVNVILYDRLAKRSARQAFLASCDTHPKDGDVKQAPLVSGAVPDRADAQPSGSPTPILPKKERPL